MDQLKDTAGLSAEIASVKIEKSRPNPDTGIMEVYAVEIIDLREDPDAAQ